jgi:hypothetical protein
VLAGWKATHAGRLNAIIGNENGAGRSDARQKGDAIQSRWMATPQRKIARPARVRE